MFRRDRTRATARGRWLLGRALLVAGAAVAGTSAAWLVGAGSEADAADLRTTEAAAPTTEPAPALRLSTVDDAVTGRPGPADSPLDRLDPLALIDSPPADSGPALTGSGPTDRLLETARPVVGTLRHSTTEVGQVASDALAATGNQAGSLSESVNSGLPELAEPLLSGETGAAPPSGSPAPPAPVQAAAPPVPQSPQQTAYRSAEQPLPFEADEPSVGAQEPEPHQIPAGPDRSQPFALPVPTGAPGCGGTADGKQPNNSAVGWYPVGLDRTPAFTGAPTRDTTGTLVSVPEPQPGTTPD